MKGKYVKGIGKANTRCKVHQAVFNTQVFGTFNVRVSNLILPKVYPAITLPTKKYWFVRLIKDKIVKYGWAIRDDNSKQRVNTLEILTKELIPDNFKEGVIDVDILKRWNKTQIQEWAKDKYWFQTFPFSPVKKADSTLVWDVIKDHANWSGKKILDYGCHYGYFSFEAAKQGAIVRGVDANRKAIKAARVIRDHIIQQDVIFSHISDKTVYNKPFDIVFYLSVHHQIDPNYSQLKATIEKYKKMARECLFVELIMPSMFPKNKSMTQAEIDKAVGGEILTTYKHKIRGLRRIYKVT